MSAILSYIWFVYLYQPIFNALIWIYSNLTEHNLGWAVVVLTIFLRIVLLPLTLISERDAAKQEEAEKEALEASSVFKNDSVAQREEFRRIMAKHHISPWAKAISLAIQLLVLFLLYQVFVQSITGERVVKVLYPQIDFPGKINTVFYGFEIGSTHDLVWPGIVALYILLSIIWEKGVKKWDRSEGFYLIIFPLFSFFLLWLLPITKSLFILTSMLFSDSITVIRKVLFSAKPAGGGHGHGHGHGHH